MFGPPDFIFSLRPLVRGCPQAAGDLLYPVSDVSVPPINAGYLLIILNTGYDVHSFLTRMGIDEGLSKAQEQLQLPSPLRIRDG